MPRKNTRAARLQVHVPQNAEEANAYIDRVADAQREIIRLETELEAEIAELKAKAAEAASAQRDIINVRVEGLQIWAAANRKALTNEGRTKTAKFPAGELQWRMAKPRVTIKNAKAVIERIKTLGITGFVRVKETINKQAMQADPERARTIEGVTIKSAGEEFIVKPASTSLEVAIDE
jgi:phage host-nuclease inhibitor protein Gam